jgi:hypothetical protein
MDTNDTSLIKHVEINIIGSVPYKVSQLFRLVKEIRNLSKDIAEENKSGLFAYELPQYISTMEDKIAGFISRSS